MRRVLLVGMLAVLAVASGCVGTVAKQAVYGVTGASPRYFEVKSLGGQISLDGYKGRAVGIEAFDASPMMGTVPASLVAEVQSAIVEKVMEMKVYASVGRGAPAGGGLLVRGKFVDFDPGGSALRAVGFGVNPFLTAQIQVIDASSGQVLGVAMVTGTVKSAVRTGPKELAEGVGKAVKGLLDQHTSKPDEKR